MSTTLARNPLTQAALTQLRTSGFTVGDGELPTGDANWIGQPNAPTSQFKPFAVLSPLYSSDSFGAVGETQGNWKLPYLVECFGVSRAQCESLADRLRDQLAELRGQLLTLGPDTYKVVYLKAESLGQPSLIEVTEPPFWHQQDTTTIWIGRSHA